MINVVLFRGGASCFPPLLRGKPFGTPLAAVASLFCRSDAFVVMALQRPSCGLTAWLRALAVLAVNIAFAWWSFCWASWPHDWQGGTLTS